MQLSSNISASPSNANTPKSKANSQPTRPLKVHFKLPVIHKASPTVSVTNTNAAWMSTTLRCHPETPQICSVSTNSVAFPSSPIPCPSRKRAHSDDGHDMRVSEEDLSRTTVPFHRRISHIDILRRRSKSYLAPSYFHTDSSQKSHLQAFPCEDVDMSDDSVNQPPVKRRPAARRESMSAGNPSGRTVRKARRIVADAQFLASMHSSISFRVRTRPESGKRGFDECAVQDALLVERIWHTLVEMGYNPNPVPLDSTSASDLPSTARELAERAARRTQVVTSPSLTLDRAQDIAPSSPNGILPVPQLVATLIMRHRERTATRPKRRAVGDGPLPQPVSRSPLSTSL